MQSSLLARSSFLLPFALTFSSAVLPAQDPGENWQLMSPATNPGERAHYMTAFFGRSGRSILFGGQAIIGDVPLAGTWEWDGKEWTELSPLGSPSPRSRAAMAYDPLRERLVLYGGFNGAVALGDTWLFDGLRWTPKQPSESPPVLLGAAMAWDPIGESLVMYGGASALEGQLQSDTWSWDGSNWTKLTPGQSPGQLKEHRMATDTKRDRIVLFGGIDFQDPFESPTYSNRTWEWTGGNWIFQDRLLVPAARADFAMAFDSIRGLTVVAYGTAGRTGGVKFGDTWLWDGSVWRDNPFLDPKPAARGDVRLVENSNTGRLMMYGGSPGGNEPLSNASETWEFFGPGIAQAAPFGAGCPGASGLAPLLASLPGSRPQLGSVFEVEFRDLPIAPGTATLAFWGLSSEIWQDTQFALPDDLGWIGMPNCDLLVSLDHLVPLNTTGSIASWTLNIPSDIGLVGFEFFLQGLILDSGANALGLTISNGIRGKVGVQ